MHILDASIVWFVTSGALKTWVQGVNKHYAYFGLTFLFPTSLKFSIFYLLNFSKQIFLIYLQCLSCQFRSVFFFFSFFFFFFFLHWTLSNYPSQGQKITGLTKIRFIFACITHRQLVLSIPEVNKSWNQREMLRPVDKSNYRNLSLLLST